MRNGPPSPACVSGSLSDPPPPSELFGSPIAQRDTPGVALESFQKIVTDEESRDEQGEFGFKALKQMTKLTFKLGRYDDALRHYKTLLTYTKKAVTRNVAEKAINRVLDYVSAEEGVGLDRMQEFYEVTMKALEEQKNEVGGGTRGASRAFCELEC